MFGCPHLTLPHPISLTLEQNSAYYFVIGAASKVAAATATYPAQVIKARLMQDAEVTGTLAYAGLVRSFVRTVRLVETPLPLSPIRCSIPNSHHTTPWHCSDKKVSEDSTRA